MKRKEKCRELEESRERGDKRRTGKHFSKRFSIQASLQILQSLGFFKLLFLRQRDRDRAPIHLIHLPSVHRELETQSKSPT